METEVTGTKEKVNRAAKLARLGLTRAATTLETLLSTKRKLAIAYENYRFVTPQNVAEFNKKLLGKTGKNMNDAWQMTYQKLDFTPIDQYEQVPPDGVLQNLEIAQDRKCFDSFEIGYIRNVKDPLLFGRVTGTPNRFFIDQWDDDVKIDDLLKENEG